MDKLLWSWWSWLWNDDGQEINENQNGKEFTTTTIKAIVTTFKSLNDNDGDNDDDDDDDNNNDYDDYIIDDDVLDGIKKILPKLIANHDKNSDYDDNDDDNNNNNYDDDFYDKLLTTTDKNLIKATSKFLKKLIQNTTNSIVKNSNKISTATIDPWKITEKTSNTNNNNNKFIETILFDDQITSNLQQNDKYLDTSSLLLPSSSSSSLTSSDLRKIPTKLLSSLSTTSSDVTGASISPSMLTNSSSSSSSSSILRLRKPSNPNHSSFSFIEEFIGDINHHKNNNNNNNNDGGGGDNDNNNDRIKTFTTTILEKTNHLHKLHKSHDKEHDNNFELSSYKNKMLKDIQNSVTSIVLSNNDNDDDYYENVDDDNADRKNNLQLRYALKAATTWNNNNNNNNNNSTGSRISLFQEHNSHYQPTTASSFRNIVGEIVNHVSNKTTEYSNTSASRHIKSSSNHSYSSPSNKFMDENYNDSLSSRLLHRAYDVLYNNNSSGSSSSSPMLSSLPSSSDINATGFTYNNNNNTNSVINSHHHHHHHHHHRPIDSSISSAINENGISHSNLFNSLSPSSSPSLSINALLTNQTSSSYSSSPLSSSSSSSASLYPSSLSSINAVNLEDLYSDSENFLVDIVLNCSNISDNSFVNTINNCCNFYNRTIIASNNFIGGGSSTSIGDLNNDNGLFNNTINSNSASGWGGWAIDGFYYNQTFYNCSSFMKSNTTSTNSGGFYFFGTEYDFETFMQLVLTFGTAITLGIIILATVIGNVFVIAAILLERNLQSVSNYLILSLAVADLLVACLVMPLSAVYEISQEWKLGPELCDMWTSSDVLCCTASILHLVAIALDRYWAVTNIDYIHHRTARRIGIMILIIWGLSFLVSVAPLLGWKDSKWDERVSLELKCMVSQDIGYQIFATASSFYVPLLVILLLYWRIFQTARKRIRRRQQAAQTHPEPLMARFRTRIRTRTTTTTTSANASCHLPLTTAIGFRSWKVTATPPVSGGLIATAAGGSGGIAAAVVTVIGRPLPTISETTTAFTNISSAHTTPEKGSYGNGMDRIEKDPQSAPAAISTTENQHHQSPKQQQQQQSTSTSSHHHHQGPQPPGIIISKDTSSSSSNNNSNTGVGVGTSGSGTVASSVNTLGVVVGLPTTVPGPPSSTSSSSATLKPKIIRKKTQTSVDSKRERKAAKTLAIITGAFVFCWLPFFALAILLPICQCDLPPIVMSLSLWLGYFNSTLNPIIYTIFSPEFRHAFKRLLCGRRNSVRRQTQCMRR